jgi:hypothetical protein
MGALALLEVLDRDGQVRQGYPVLQWPLRIGRGLDNDVVLGDPHVAARHLQVAPDEHGELTLRVADTRNGVLLGRTRLSAGQSAVLAPDGEPVDISVGRTHLRLRLAGHALAAELPLAPTTGQPDRASALVLGAAVLVTCGLLFSIYLVTDPDAFARAAGSALLSAVLGAATWCGAWALLTKTFTRHARFGWHLRVFLCASVALLVTNSLPALLAFAFSSPWLTDFSFVADIAVGATALYFHLLAVEPARPRLLKGVAATCALVGVALALWFNYQRSDLFGTELYMSHLFPPAVRLARPVSTDAFVDALAPLKATLDARAKHPAGGGDGTGGADGDDD